MGYIEPHEPLLTLPKENQLIYKVMSIENLIRSFLGNYLYFNRVDKYIDFKNADSSDGEQLPLDRPGNFSSKFKKNPSFSAGDYYDRARNRTYACCFSLKNSDYIWRNYGKGGKKGKICIVFDFQKLRKALNDKLQDENVCLNYNGAICRQFFDINYGIVNYIERSKIQLNSEYLANPIQYAYLKDTSYKNENELRVTLSGPSAGHLQLADGSIIEFPSGLFMSFDFMSAIENKTILKILSNKNEEFDCFPINLNFNIF